MPQSVSPWQDFARNVPGEASPGHFRVYVEKHYQKELFMGKFLTWNVWGVDCLVPNVKVPNYLLWASWLL